MKDLIILIMAMLLINAGMAMEKLRNKLDKGEGLTVDGVVYKCVKIEKKI